MSKPRISMMEYEQSPEEIKREFDYQIAKNGRITNMKRTALHSLPAYKALMEWYTLRDELIPVIGEWGVIVLSHAISTQTDCLICSTFFRKAIVDFGKDPDQLQFTEKEQVLIDYGRQLVQDSNQVSDELFARLRQHFNEEEIVLITVFAGIMIATNTFNNALKIPLDEVLYAYRRKSD